MNRLSFLKTSLLSILGINLIKPKLKSKELIDVIETKIENKIDWQCDIRYFLTQHIMIPYKDNEGIIYNEFNTYNEYWALCARINFTAPNIPISYFRQIKFQSNPGIIQDFTNKKVQLWLSKVKIKAWELFKENKLVDLSSISKIEKFDI